MYRSALALCWNARSTGFLGNERLAKMTPLRPADMLKLRRITTHAFDVNSYEVISTLTDGYDLRVGNIRMDFGAYQRAFWRWEAPGSGGESHTREEAMTAFRQAFKTVTEQQLALMREQRDHTAWKYAIWDIGGRFETADPAGTYRFQRCPCGETIDCWDQAAVMPHVGHIEGMKRSP